jgi:hypothetical protein
MMPAPSCSSTRMGASLFDARPGRSLAEPHVEVTDAETRSSRIKNGPMIEAVKSDYYLSITTGRRSWSTSLS